MKKIISQFSLLIILFTALNGCGFHLRGHEPLPPQLRIMYLQSNSPYSALTKELRQTLQSIKIILAQNAHDAPVTLQILSDQFKQQVTSLGASGQTSTFLLTYDVSFQLLNRQGQIIVGPETASSSHNYSITTNQVLGGLNYQSNLQNQMQREVIYQIMDRLRSYRTQQALQSVS